MLTAQSALRKDKTTAAGATMSHQHFSFIAATLADLYPEAPIAGELSKTAWADVVDHFADALTATNPRFDRARFLRVCGVGE